MTTLEQAARQALEALETISVDVKTTSNAYEAQRQAIAALSHALEQPKREWEQFTNDDFERLCKQFAYRCQNNCGLLAEIVGTVEDVVMEKNHVKT